MIPCRRNLRHMLAVATFWVATAAWAQQPFDLDPSFRTNMNSWYVSSILPLPDGKVFLSGQIKFPGDQSFRGGARLLPTGQQDMSFTNFIGGGKLTPWNDRIYVQAGSVVRRIMNDGMLDPEFGMSLDPYVSFLQGGDYHIYPDGRVLLSGVHVMHDTVRNFLGPHCLIWFTNTGKLDTTAHHRTCAGSLDFFTELPNGQFIGTGSTSVWDGQTASNIVRFNADGSLDPSFQANVWWGQAYGFLSLPDGRIYAGGNFRIAGISDTLNLVRFMPDGSLDPTFNNTAKFRDIDALYPSSPPWGIVRSIHPFTDTTLIVSGNFGNIDGQTRGGIALIDAAGNLLDDLFAGNGCGVFIYQPNTSQPPLTSYRVISKVVPAPDGSYYIYGAYTGYDDGTTNDPTQRFVSRLHGLNVGISETQQGTVQTLQIAPNPSSGATVLSVASSASATAPVNAMLTIHDGSGRVVWQTAWPAGAERYTLPAGALAPGAYVVRVASRASASGSGHQGPGAETLMELYTGRLVVMPD